MANPFNDPAAERSNKRVLAEARRQADDPTRIQQEAERRARIEEREREKASLGTPISELSGRPGEPGYERFRDIAASWGYD